ncbi:fumarylacetoacetate hydrolase family protein [Aliarcobacter butzleri]|uniref:fumarylacetoacetate hydrolase family protein n=1 Tax=Aliarcobacter butzleri TaxID=28197 RepID=UPI001EDAE25D|nr:fumarylacetoacetate hydrolase family protein [Aliarcobacter butzleri]MCG3692492.1 fumarylacetoacetate hydrolase family protein [Aliarcobacter butzleri]
MNYINFNNKKINPSKIICVGRNFVDHITELNNEIPENIVIFNKPNSSISHELFYFSEDTRFEGELCFLVANKKIIGIGFGLDLTKANIQNKMKEKGLPWERAKSFNGSAVFSNFIEFNGDMKNLTFKLFINEKLQQEGNYELMIYKPEIMIEEIETFMSIEDGDIIMSGTPKGVGTYKVNDTFRFVIYYKEEILVENIWNVKNNNGCHF